MNRAATNSDANPLAPCILLLLLSYWISGVESYRVVAPARYIALQGHLNATVYLTPTTPAKDTTVYTWDTENQTFIPKSPSSSVTDSDPINEELYDGDDSNKISPELLNEFTEPMQPLPVVAISRDDYGQDLPDIPQLPPKIQDLETSISLSLFANGSVTPIHTLPVDEGRTYEFMCGLIVQGGTYFFRLQRGKEILALSNNVEVAWPDISLEVPKEVQTYHSDVQVIFRFNGELCKPLKPIDFHAWIELLYHGVPPGKETSPGSKRCGIPDPKRSWNKTFWDDLRNRRALRKFHKRVKGRGRKGKNAKKKKKRKGKKKKKKTNQRNGIRKYGDLRNESVPNSDIVNSFVVNASTNSIVSSDSTNESDVYWTPKPHSDIARTPSPYESRTTVGGVSVIVRGRKKGRRRKKKRRKTKEVLVHGRISKENQLDESDYDDDETFVSKAKIKGRVKGRRRRKKKPKKDLNLSSGEENEDEGEVIVSEPNIEPFIPANNKNHPQTVKNLNPEMNGYFDNETSGNQNEYGDLRHLKNMEEDITIPSIPEPEIYPDSEEDMQYHDEEVSDYEELNLGTQTFIPDGDIADYVFSEDENNPLIDQQNPGYQQDTLSTVSGLQPEVTTSSLQENSFSTTHRSLVMPLSEAERHVTFEEDELPFLEDFSPNGLESEGQIEDFQRQQLNNNDLLSFNEEATPSNLEATSSSPEQSLVMDQQNLSDEDEASVSEEQFASKTKRNVAGEENRYHSAYLKRSQATMVSSGYRGKSSAWGGEVMILGRAPLEDNLYSNQVRDVKFPCGDIGPAGLYSVRLVTDTHSNPIITNSKWFTVSWSESFSIYVHDASIVPCRGVVGVQVTYPMCIGGSDKVRVYARVRANVTSVNPPIENKYIVERRIIKGRHTIQFPCDTFTEYATEYCFFYVNTAKTQAVSDIDKCCVPMYKQHVIRQNGQWGSWNSWSACTAKCGTGERIRHRFCDSPRPRSGGEYCMGDSLESQPCNGTDCVEPSVYAPPASTPGGERCGCGCTLGLTSGVLLNITASAADCMGTAVWLLEASEGERVTAEVVWAILKPGAQWLKLRDGDSLSSPLLVSLPRPKAANSFPSLRQLSNAPPQTSLGNRLILEFRSDINVTSATINPAAWGFLVRVSSKTAEVLATAVGTVGETAQSGMYWKLLAGMHIAAVVFISALVAAVIVLAVYNWRRYRLYRRAKLIPESPYMTPPSTPSREVATGSSTLTLTEVISLKSMVFRPKIPVSLPLRRKGSASSYSALDDRQPEEPRHSLPNSPFLTRRAATPSTIRRSSSQLGRFLKKGNGNFKKKKRRFGSVDELEIRCISPIHETHREDDGGGDKDEITENKNKNGEDVSAKYKEYRKSLIGSDAKDRRLPHKLVKDKMNLERIRRSAISRSNSNATMRGSSSVSDISVNGTDNEMEYDYYDYDMDNASAVPGSIFGLDPLLLAWVPPFIPMGGECTPPDEGIPLDVIVNASVHEVDTEAVTPTAEPPTRPKVLPLEKLNIPPTEPPRNSMETSIRSEEANDRIELLDKTSEDTPSQLCDDDPTPTTEICSKILNLDDFQFADDTDEDDDLCDL